MSIWKSKTVISYSLIIGTVFLILAFVRLPTTSFLWREFSNFGHTPLFGMIALALLGILTKILPAGFPRFFQYLLAAVGASLMGLGYELIQIPTAGNADPADVVRNSAGIFGLLSLRLAADRAYWQNRQQKNPKRRFGWLATGLIVLIMATLPLMVWAVAYFERDNSFPQLSNFDSLAGRLFITNNASSFEPATPPDSWNGASSENAGLITCYPGFKYPGILIDDPVPDWENYSYLYLEIFSTADVITPFIISIEDHHHNRQYEDRHSSRLELLPGLNRLELPLDSIRITPSGRLLDLTAMARLNLFAPAPKDTLRFYLGDLLLR